MPFHKPTHMMSNDGNASPSNRSIGEGAMETFEDRLNKVSEGQDQTRKNEIATTDNLVLEKFNLNSAYLLMLARIMDEFSVIKCNAVASAGQANPEIYYHMWEQLDLMENILSCKQLSEKRIAYKQRLKDLLIRIKNVGVSNDQGIFVNSIDYLEIRTDLGILFEDFLIDMENRGLLTFKQESPLLAMSKFND